MEENMINADVSYPIALGAGILSFFSPCLLPMIPAYIMYVSGADFEEDLSRRKFLAVTRTLGFIIGFTIIFMVMGTSASFLGRFFIQNKQLFLRISGLLIIAFGLNMMGVLKLGFLSSDKRVKSPKKITNWFSSILMGMAFAAGWTPCFGPVLASILVYAGSAGTISKGVLLLLIYSIGMAIPFMLTALFINVFTRLMEKAESFMKYMPYISGIILVIFGILIFFNKMIDISKLLL
ncbi:cytochrome c biogenesis CcdA family protein [Gudongella oleilytica]|jgi:cytochrome c-type biogenesis protein|uniref:cytochrome c biogenesis CcdA family protein n=1 Tax=Gudongella oleilytica TaxID=1582259 RepID=UPI002A36C136|nr:cytochrome c biogenesis CcdA family protein [Gudongella oleilytica]